MRDQVQGDITYEYSAGFDQAETSRLIDEAKKKQKLQTLLTQRKPRRGNHQARSTAGGLAPKKQSKTLSSPGIPFDVNETALPRRNR